MAHMTITRKSGALGRETQLHILAPNGTVETPLKVLYLLHGLSDDSTCWTRFTSLESILRDAECVVVMPEGGRSFYNDTPYRECYFTYLTQELPKWIQFMFPISKKREDTFIAGQSMGGYGSLKAALTYPEQYGGVAVLSSVCDVRRHFEDESLPVKVAFGEKPDWSSLDLYTLAEKANFAPEKPKIYQWCGMSDFLYEDNKKFQTHMESLSFDYHFCEGEGDHMWKYWDKEVVKALSFLDLTKKQ
ncbi:MAG: hypothetical protein E7399_05610 [Ruminococcaceae bacterium]|nr:hypothetical protein [Oscillospiraceae bacterium]